jgi:hypothetical protein
VKVDSPLGAYPVQFRRVEHREDGVAIVALVAGLKSDLILERRELLAATGAILGTIAAAGALGYLWRASR